MAILRLIIATIAVAFPEGPFAAQAAPTFARVEALKSVEILDLRRHAWQRVYQVAGWVTVLTVGPSNDRLAFLSWSEQATSDSDSPRLVSELIVIDTAGRVLPSMVKQVQRYAWCGPGCLVYITGQEREGEVGFTPDGLGMLDVATGRTTRLPAPTYPIAIIWAAFDGAAYVKNSSPPGEARIYKLDLAARTLEPTPLLDHVFSPTGRYYLHDREYSGSLAVYQTKTNKPVNLDSLRREAIVLQWASPTEDVLLTVKRPPRRIRAKARPTPKKPGDREPEATYRLYDVARRRIRATVTGHLRSWAASNNRILVQRGSQYQVIGEP
jgi:hypothetical protein